MVSLLGHAQSSGNRSVPFWRLAALALISQASLTLVALRSELNLRAALAIGSISLAAIVLAPTLRSGSELSAVASSVADKTFFSDVIVMVASCVVWRGQTPFEETAMEVFRSGGAAAAAVSVLSSIFLSWWLQAHESIPQLFVSAAQWAGAIAQLFLASVLFPRSPYSEYVWTVPLYLLAGFAQHFLVGLSVKPEPQADARAPEAAAKK